MRDRALIDMIDNDPTQVKSEDKTPKSSFVTRRTILAGALTVGAGAMGLTQLSTLAADDEKGDGSNMSNGTDSPEASENMDTTNGAKGMNGMKGTFTVRIENVSTGMTLETTAMKEALKEQPVPLSPGAFCVHRGTAPIFSSGEPARENGLEEIAEDGMPKKLTTWLAEQTGVSQSGAFPTPVGADAPSPLTPDHAYEFDITAKPGEKLSFATMFVPSNDLFYSPDEMGIALFESGKPIDSDVTDQVMLWDAGTEINEEPGVGENQVQRQRGAGVGLVERETVVPISEVNGYSYPNTSAVITVTISPQSGGMRDRMG